MRISKITIFFSIFIIISAAFMRQLSDFLKASFGQTVFLALIGIILAGAGLVLFIIAIKHNPGLIRISGVALLLIAGLILAWQIRIPIERIHIMEYGILGWLAAKDLIKKEKRIRQFILACIFITIVGVLDESFQAVLPYRFFDLRDIGFNSLGGTWGIVLYLLGTL